VVNTVGLVLMVALEPVRLDLDETLSNGAIVFRTAEIDGGATDGYVRLGMIVVADDQPEHYLQRVTLPHELIHVLQGDAWEQLVALPTERALLRRLAPAHAPALARADLGALGPVAWHVANLGLDYWHRPTEVEAFHLTEGPNWRENYR
jgi:hypothetical protein